MILTPLVILIKKRTGGMSPRTSSNNYCILCIIPLLYINVLGDNFLKINAYLYKRLSQLVLCGNYIGKIPRRIFQSP